MSLKGRLVEWYIRRRILKAVNRGLKMKNWKTTLAGIAMAAIQLHQGGMTWGNAAIAALMALFGLAAKDHDVTGGKKVQE